MNRYTSFYTSVFVSSVFVICAALALVSGVSVAAGAADAGQTPNQTPPKTPKQVQQALDWQMPKHSCHKPKPPGQRKDIIDSQGVSRQEWDVDYYTLKRYNRKEERWENCVDNYKAGLRKDFETLKSSAQYGLTQAQADLILGKLKAIQTVLMEGQTEAPKVSKQAPKTR